MFKHIRRNWSVLFLGTLIVLLLFDPNLVTPKQVFGSSASIGEIIPLYSYPVDTWDEMIKAKKVHPSNTVSSAITSHTVNKDDESLRKITLELLQNATLTAYYEDSNMSLGVFTNLNFTQGNSYVLLTGQYTDGEKPYKILFIRLNLYDKQEGWQASGTGFISDIDAYKTKTFDVICRTSYQNLASYHIQVDSAIPK